MSVDVGTAYVSIIPSARGFSKALKKELAKEFANSGLDRVVAEQLANQPPVRLPVEPEVDRRSLPDEIPVPRNRRPKVPVELDPVLEAFQAQIRRETAELARQVNVDVPATADTTDLRSELSAEIAEIQRQVRAEIPTEPGGRRGYELELRRMVNQVSERVRASIPVDVDLDIDRDIDDRVERAVDRDGRGLGSLFSSAFGASATEGIRATTGSIQGAVQDAARPLTMLGGTLAGVIAIPVAGLAAVTAGAGIAAAALGTVGAGFIGIGVAALAADPAVKKAFDGFKTGVVKVLADAAAPLKGPLIEGLAIILDVVKDLGPDLRYTFETLAPSVKALAAGFGDFIRAAAPGLLAAIRASGPLLESLAYNLKPLGEAVSQFFGIIAHSGPGAIRFINILVEVLSFALKSVAALVLVLSLAFNAMFVVGEKLVAAVKRTWESIRAIFDKDGASLLEKVNAIVGKIIRFFVDGFNYLKRLWRSVTGDLVATFAGLPRRIAGGIASTIGQMGRLGSGARAKVGEVIAVFRGIPGRLRAAMGNLGGLLWSAGQAVIRGFIGGLQSMIGSLGGVLGGITAFVAANKGPLDKDRKLLIPAGQAIMGGLIEGLRSQRPDLQSELDAVTGQFSTIGPKLAAGPLALSATANLQPGELVARWVGTGNEWLDAARSSIRISYGGDPMAALSGR